MPPIFCKDSANREKNKKNSFFFSSEMPPILFKDSANRRQYKIKKFFCFYYGNDCQAFVIDDEDERFYKVKQLLGEEWEDNCIISTDFTEKERNQQHI
jgi:hypothetical protein